MTIILSAGLRHDYAFWARPLQAWKMESCDNLSQYERCMSRTFIDDSNVLYNLANRRLLRRRIAPDSLDFCLHLSEEVHHTSEDDKQNTTSRTQSQDLGQETLV